MGNSVQTQRFNNNDWKIVPSLNTHEVITLQNARNKNIHVEKYPVYLFNSKQQDKFKEIYYFRKNNKRIVSALYYQQKDDSSFCPSNHQTSFIFIEKIQLRLSNIEAIPFPDILHVYDQCIHGYFQFAKYMGCFKIQKDYIGMNQFGVIKVWGGPQWINLPMNTNIISEQQMIKGLLKIIDQVTLQQTLPPNVQNPRNFILNQLNNRPTFQKVIQKFMLYVNMVNNGKILSSLVNYRLVSHRLNYFSHQDRSKIRNIPQYDQNLKKNIEPIISNVQNKGIRTVNNYNSYPNLNNFKLQAQSPPQPLNINKIRTASFIQNGIRPKDSLHYQDKIPFKTLINPVPYEQKHQLLINSIPQPQISQQRLNKVKSQPNLPFNPSPIKFNQQPKGFVAASKFSFDRIIEQSQSHTIVFNKNTKLAHNMPKQTNLTTVKPYRNSSQIIIKSNSSPYPQKIQNTKEITTKQVQKSQNNHSNSIVMNQKASSFPLSITFSSKNSDLKFCTSSSQTFKISQTKNAQDNLIQQPLLLNQPKANNIMEVSSPIQTLQSKYITPMVNKSNINYLNSIEEDHHIKQSSPLYQSKQYPIYIPKQSLLKTASYPQKNSNKEIFIYQKYTMIQKDDGKSSQSFIKSLRQLKSDFDIQKITTKTEKYDPFKFSRDNQDESYPYKNTYSSVNYNNYNYLQDNINNRQPYSLVQNSKEDLLIKSKNNYDQYKDTFTKEIFKEKQFVNSYSSLNNYEQRNILSNIAEQKAFDQQDYSKKYANKYDSYKFNQIDPDLLEDLGKYSK